MRWICPSSPNVPWITLKATSVPAGTVKSVDCTSTGVTFARSSRKALITPSPDLSETFRSDPGPPMRTAICMPAISRFMKDFCIGGEYEDEREIFPRSFEDPFGFANDLHLGAEIDIALS